MKNKRYIGSYEELDALFDFANSNSDSRIHAEVKQKINEIKDRHIYNQIEMQMNKMSIRDKKN